jgi:hypothetical protein
MDAIRARQRRENGEASKDKVGHKCLCETLLESRGALGPIAHFASGDVDRDVTEPAQADPKRRGAYTFFTLSDQWA